MMAVAAAAQTGAAMIELLQSPYTIGSLIDQDLRAFLYCPDCDETSDIDLYKVADRSDGIGSSLVPAGQLNAVAGTGTSRRGSRPGGSSPEPVRLRSHATNNGLPLVGHQRGRPRWTIRQRQAARHIGPDHLAQKPQTPGMKPCQGLGLLNAYILQERS